MTRLLRLPVFVVTVAAGLAGGGCDDAGSDSPFYERLLERQVIEVGGGEPRSVRMGPPGDQVELDIPGDVVSRRAQITVSLVAGVPRRGRTPVGDQAVLVEPAMLTFDQPVRFRQRVPPPPPMRGYVAVVLTDAREGFRPGTPARRTPAPPMPGDDREVWEGDGTGSGLWGLAVD